MKIIAFKRHKSIFKDKIVRALDHDDWVQAPDLIVEYADTESFEVGFHKEKDGYEFLPEDLFLIELNKNQTLRDEFLAAQKKKQELKAKMLSDDQIVEKKLTRELDREFEEFKRWKDSKRIQKEEARGKKR